jgi:lipopolysaccharide export system permease protein
MFTILDRQMIVNYFKAYVFCLVSLMGLFVVVDLFMNLEDFTSNKSDFADVAKFIGVFYGYKSFQIFDRLCESVILLAGMFTVAWMQRNNELVPLLSAGVSTRRVVQPVLICAGAMMGLAAINQEFGLPSIDSFMLENRKNPDGSQETEVKGIFDMWGTLVSADKAVRKEGLLKGFNAVIPQRPGRNSITTLQAKEAYYIPEQENDKRSGGFLLKYTRHEGQMEWANEDDIVQPLGDGVYFLKTKGVDLDTVVRVKNWFMYLPTWKLLEELDRPGNTQHATLAIVFHTRMTRPVVGIILILLGLSVILRDQNRNVFVSAGLCLALSAVFFASIFACQWLGKDESASQYVSPALAAWLPVIVYGPCALVMYDAVHT